MTGPVAKEAQSQIVTGSPGEKDAKEAATAPKYGEVWQQIQSKFGARAEKPREIKKNLGKDDFLRIMITQMRHQDPTQPFKAEQMATEMAQFTNVEQMHNMNQTLSKIASQSNPMERLAMTGMIGKTVTVDRERFPHAEGSGDTLSFVLPRGASGARLSVLSEAGEVVHEKDMGALTKGEHSYSWDGTKKNTLPAKSGTYYFRITAKDEKEQSINIDAQMKTRVVGVSFEAGEPVFLVGNLSRPDKVTMQNIVRIEDAGMLAPAQLQKPEDAGQQKVPDLISFKKGEGSRTMQPGEIPPEVQRVLAGMQQQNAINQQPVADTEKGFPSGLGKQDD